MANIKLVMTFDDGPHDGAAGNSNRTEKVLDALDGFIPGTPIKGAFFIQTHVPNRLPSANGSKMGARMHKDKHVIAIHTGSLKDHRCHKWRVTQPADLAETANGLESDMFRAIEALHKITGIAPKFVRATFGYTNDACMAVYASSSLKHVMWDIDSTDTGQGADQASISAHLTSQTKKEIDAGKTELIYLFHDINPITSAHIKTFLGNIEAAVKAKGHTPQFLTTAAEIEAVFTSKSRKGDDKPCPAWSTG